MKRKQYTGLSRSNALAGYLFSLPFLIGFFLLFLFPVAYSVYMSFHSMSAGDSGLTMEFAGFANYYHVLREDAYFIKDYLVDSLSTLGIQFPSILIFSFFIAVVLNQKFRGRTFARVLFFLPVIVSSGVIMLVQNNQVQSVTMSGITAAATSDETGVAQLTHSIMDMVDSINFGPGIFSFINSAVSNIYTIVISSGIQILIYLAGLQTISPSLYEASSIEGASGWESFWKITFPMISPLILVNAIYTIIDNMSGLTNRTVYYIYNMGYSYGEYGYSAAMSWIYFAIIFVILGLFIFVASRLVYYEN